MTDQRAYFWGGVAVNWSIWQAMSFVGIALADVIPTDWGIGFAGTLALLGITGTLLVDRGTWIAAAVAACATVAAVALPFHLDIVVAIAAAVAIGVLVDHLGPARAVACRGGRCDGRLRRHDMSGVMRHERREGARRHRGPDADHDRHARLLHDPPARPADPRLAARGLALRAAGRAQSPCWCPRSR